MKHIYLISKNAFIVFVMLLGISTTANATLGWSWGHHYRNSNKCYTGSVCGQVLEDKNRNSHYDSLKDKGLQGIKIKLTDCKGNVYYAITNQSGYYVATNVRIGLVRVEVVPSSLPAGAKRVYGTEPTWVEVYQNCNAWAGRDGYIIMHKDTSVCGSVYEDINGNGRKDSGEHGQANIKVKICYIKTVSQGSDNRDCQRSKICMTLTTDGQGNYCTTKVPAGKATVTVIKSTLPVGAKLTAGMNPNTIIVRAHKDNEAGNDGYQHIKVAGITNATAQEGVTLSHAVTVTGSVDVETYNFNIANDSAIAGEDFNATPSFSNTAITYDANAGTITVPAGVTQFNVLVQSYEDATIEGDEQYKITVGTKTATGTITESTAKAVQSLSDATAQEGGTLSHVVTVTGSVDVETYNFTIANDSAIAGEDFNATPSFSNTAITYDANAGTITVPAGVTQFNVLVHAYEDNESEVSETYTLEVDTKTATGMITDDTPVVVDTIFGGRETEGDYIGHKVVLSHTPASAVDFTFSFENLTASDNDYDASDIKFIENITIIGNTLTVPKGVKEFVLYVKTNEDNIKNEGTETYKILLDDKSAIGEIEDAAS
jgi:hypothetical protein